MSLHKIWAPTAECLISAGNSGELWYAHLPIFTTPVETRADVTSGADALAELPAFEVYPNTAASWSGRLRCSREWWLAARVRATVRSSPPEHRL